MTFCKWVSVDNQKEKTETLKFLFNTDPIIFFKSILKRAGIKNLRKEGKKKWERDGKWKERNFLQCCWLTVEEYVTVGFVFCWAHIQRVREKESFSFIFKESVLCLNCRLHVQPSSSSLSTKPLFISIKLFKTFSLILSFLRTENDYNTRVLVFVSTYLFLKDYSTAIEFMSVEKWRSRFDITFAQVILCEEGRVKT